MPFDPNTYLSDELADEMATELFNTLTSDLADPPTTDLTLPDYEFEEDNDSVLYQDPTAVTIEDLTQVHIGGSGVFDKMMQAVNLHIDAQYKQGRITGDQFGKVYAEVISGVMAQAANFTLQMNTSKWQAIAAQMEARSAEVNATTARVLLEKAKMDAQASSYQMQTLRAGYALSKMQIANANVQHLLLSSQVEEQRYKVTELLPITKDQQQYTLDTLMVDQHKLLAEQMESERAKTLDTRTNGSVVAGSIGKQKDLYTEQINSFIKDAKYKTAKLYFDGWATQKTIDGGTSPDELTNTNVNEVLLANRAAVGLD